MSYLPLLMRLGSNKNTWEVNTPPGQYNRIRSASDLLDWGITPHEMQIVANLPSVRNARKRKSENQFDDIERIGNMRSQMTKDGFQVIMNVADFRPNEITVKTVDHSVIVEAKHEERLDEHGQITRHFQRKFQLPKGYDQKHVIASLSSDNVLTINAHQPQSSSGNERILQIQQTGPAHLNVKENPPKESDKSKKN